MESSGDEVGLQPRPRVRAEVVSDRLAGVYTIGLVAVLFVVGAYASRTAVPYNALAGEDRAFQWLPGLIPQGWSFFTRSPREDQVLIYAHRGGAWRLAYTQRFGATSNLFGANRTVRARNMEAATVLGMLPDSAWIQCPSEDRTCLSEIAVFVTLRHPAKIRTLCDTIGFILREPRPWAWSRGSEMMPGRSAVVRLQC